jgi:hypothetical protein
VIVFSYINRCVEYLSRLTGCENIPEIASSILEDGIRHFVPPERVDSVTDTLTQDREACVGITQKTYLSNERRRYIGNDLPVVL